MDRARLARLIMPLLGELTRFAGWLAASSEEANEVVQDTVVRALDASEGFRDPERIKPWLFRIARSAHIDRRRRRAARDRFIVLEGGLDDLADIATPAVPLPVVDPAELERALRELPEPARMALLLTDLWGFGIDEVAGILEIPTGTVKSRVARARMRVAASLSDAPANGTLETPKDRGRQS